MNEREIFEYNYRQIILMESRIKFYGNSEISIKKFIDDMDALISWIQNPPDEWVRWLKNLLWEIEIIYATALAHDENLTKEKLQQISDFVDQIKKEILWYKKKFLSSIQDEY